MNSEHPTVANASRAMEIEADLMVENHQEAHDIIAENEAGAIVEAENGQLYRVLA